MPCPHYRIMISTRSKSPPTTASAAYQSGERLYDERTHRTKNYDDKRGVIYTEIMLPDNAPREYADRNTLWNAVEWSETNWNAQMARKLHITLPRELSMDDNLKLIREYVQDQFVSQGMIADIAIHDPDPPNHNPHAHVMLTMRALDEQGHWLPKCHREYVLDENGDRIKGENGKWKFRKVFTTDWDNRDNAEKWRQAWEDIQNRYLEAADRPERISMKSYERQGIDQIPTVHMGPAVTAKSINSDRILWLLFGAYCIALFLILFVRKRFNIGDEPYWEQVKMSINLVPFRTIYGSLYSIIHRTIPYLIPHEIISLLGNFALFMPFGYFIPRLFEKYRVFIKFILFTFVVLLSIETLQVLTIRGCFDVDDIILNLAGAVIGFFIARKVKSRKQRDAAS